LPVIDDHLKKILKRSIRQLTNKTKQ
jgi:hypothetical protein